MSSTTVRTSLDTPKSTRAYPREMSVGAFFGMVFGVLAMLWALIPHAIWVGAIPLSGIGLMLAGLAFVRAYTGKILGRILPVFAVLICGGALAFTYYWPEIKPDVVAWAGNYIPQLRPAEPSTPPSTEPLEPPAESDSPAPASVTVPGNPLVSAPPPLPQVPPDDSPAPAIKPPRPPE